MNRNQSPHQKNELTSQEKRSLDSLFDSARQAEQEYFTPVSEQETNDAYTQVALEVQASRSFSYWKYTAAAVVIMGLVSIVWTLTPKKITVPNGQTEVIKLFEGTTITLNSGSTLTYPRWFSLWERTVSLNGEAYFEVRHNGEPFNVETPNARVTVMGTKFNVRSWRDGTEPTTSVFLKEGKVSLGRRNTDNQNVILSPGQSSSITGNGRPAAPKEADPEKAAAWLSNGLAFENQPISVIFDEISRRFDVQVRTNNDRLLQDSLTIYISEMKGAEQTLADICRVKNLDYTTTGNTFIISKAK